MDRDRRRYLGLLAGALAGTAGCLGDGGGDATPTDGGGDGLTRTPAGTPQPTPTPTPSESPTATEGPTGTATESTSAPSLVLNPVEASSDAPLTVYPPTLASVLRSAATGDGPVRATADAFVYAPEPVLPGFDAVEIVDPVGDASGTYQVTCDGGPYHMMTLRAEEVPAGEADEPTPVSAYPEAYRDLVVSVLTDSTSREAVEPQTERGEWVREHFFGEYVEYEGQVYLGRETHGTDAVFFSTEVWYVLSLSPVDDAADAVTLRLPEIDPSVRATVDAALEEWSKQGTAPAVAGPPLGEPVRSFADDTDRILTHTWAYGVAVRPWDETDWA